MVARFGMRPEVARYLEWKNRVRTKANQSGCPHEAIALDWTAYMPIPKAWSKKKRMVMAGQPHQVRPDRDNIDKGIMDALFEEDSRVAFGQQSKRWDDGHGPRIIIKVFSREGV